MIQLSEYAGKNICVAVSGGRDSMALLHYIHAHMREHAIILTAVNCNHKMRKEASDRDSGFVKSYCQSLNIPLITYVWDTDIKKTEASARQWRRDCYKAALAYHNADFIATAHHMNDNAETVLFNLSRGSALSGLTGICDKGTFIRPLISLTRGQIDEYVKQNCVPYVDDETNLTDDYTRNRIRHNVLPELERAVPDAVKAIYRFSRLAAEDEEYFDRLIGSLGLITEINGGYKIKFCAEKVVFRRAAIRTIKLLNRKDYTLDIAERLYLLQTAENGKRFEFLGLAAYKEEGGVAICECAQTKEQSVPFINYTSRSFGGMAFRLSETAPAEKYLKFDPDKIPSTAEIRFAREGDRFKKFGGGTKSLGDYFTDKKIPARLRKSIPLIADGSDVLVIGGVEISDKVKITDDTEKVVYLTTDQEEL